MVWGERTRAKRLAKPDDSERKRREERQRTWRGRGAESGSGWGNAHRSTDDGDLANPEGDAEKRDGTPDGGRRYFSGGSGANETLGGIDIARRLGESGTTLLESVGLSRMNDSVEVKTVPLSGATRQRGR